MTVRDLLRHTAGLSYGIFSDTPVDKMYRERGVLYRGDVAAMVESLGEIPLLYQPGSKWHYSVAVDVLGRLVEVLSGKSLDDFLRERINKSTPTPVPTPVTVSDSVSDSVYLFRANAEPFRADRVHEGIGLSVEPP